MKSNPRRCVLVHGMLLADRPRYWLQWFTGSADYWLTRTLLISRWHLGTVRRLPHTQRGRMSRNRTGIRGGSVSECLCKSRRTRHASLPGGGRPHGRASRPPHEEPEHDRPEERDPSEEDDPPEVRVGDEHVLEARLGRVAVDAEQDDPNGTRIRSCDQSLRCTRDCRRRARHGLSVSRRKGDARGVKH